MTFKKKINHFLNEFNTTKVLISGATFIIVCIWLATFFRLNQDKQFMLEQSRSNLQNIAISFKEHSLASIRNTDQALRIVKYHYEQNGSKDFSLLNGYFDRQAIDVSFLNQVGIINEKGIYEFSNLKNHKQVDLSDREHFKIHQSGFPYPLYVSKPVLGRASGKWSIQLTRRIDYPDGSFKGVAVASFNPNYFLDYHRQIDLGSDSLVTLMGLDGYARTLKIGGTVRSDDSIQKIDLPQEIQQSNSGWFVTDALFDHVKRLYVYERLNEQPLFVMVGMLETEVFAEYKRIQNSYLLAAVLLSILIALFVSVAMYFIRRVETSNAELFKSYQALDKAKQLEQEMNSRLTQSEKMAALGQLAAGVAHEINNPMAFVSSNLNTMRKYAGAIEKLLTALQKQQTGEMSDTELQAYKSKLNLDFVLTDLKTIFDETEDGVFRVKHIVNDLKNFSRGDTEQPWALTDLKQGIQSTLNIVKHEVKNRAEIFWDWQDLPDVECIPSQINQVFMNLIVNAAQAIPSGQRGIITLRSGFDDQAVWIEVCDNGSGISPDKLNRIFDPFYTTKEFGVGTGLGLSVSLGIVQRHRGELTVKSDSGKGTCMRVQLPLRRFHAS